MYVYYPYDGRQRRFAAEYDGDVALFAFLLLPSFKLILRSSYQSSFIDLLQARLQAPHHFHHL